MKKVEKQSKWIHINFYIGEKHDSSKDDHSSFMKLLLCDIYCGIFTFMNRGFYLGEGDFIMFSVEMKHKHHLPIIKKKIKDLMKDIPKEYISKVKYEIGTDDYKNGEGFLFIMDAMMKYNLLHEDNSYAHIIHCMTNSLLMAPGQESDFYKAMAKSYRYN